MDYVPLQHSGFGAAFFSFFFFDECYIEIKIEKQSGISHSKHSWEAMIHWPFWVLSDYLLSEDSLALGVFLTLLMFVFDLAEPFDRTNTARAVHEKHKFDIIKGEILKVKSASHLIFPVTLAFKIVIQMLVIDLPISDVCVMNIFMLCTIGITEMCCQKILWKII